MLRLLQRTVTICTWYMIDKTVHLDPIP